MGRTSADQFLEAAETGHLAIVRKFITENQNKINLINEVYYEEDRLPAIALASLCGHIDVVKALIAAGADVNAHIGKGATALFTAAWCGNLDIVRLLTSVKGIDLNPKVARGDTPLALAARLGDLHIVKHLLAAGATIYDFEQLVSRTRKMGWVDIANLLQNHSSQQSTSPVATRNNQSTKRSRDVFEDLDNRKLIAHYTDWSDKKTGVMSGATLYGVNKFGHPKKVFVKSYRDGGYGGGGHFDELIDYAAFYILKKCGVSVPKAKLKGAVHRNSEKVYMFSTDMVQAKLERLTKKYRFYEASYLPTGSGIWNGCLKSKTDLFPDVKTKGNDFLTKQYYEYPLDITSSIRSVFLQPILGLSDFHGGNNGFLVSNDNGNVKTKFGLIDFCNDIKNISTLGLTLRNFIHTHCLDVPAEVRNGAKESDYIAAFAKIEANFLNACNEVTAKVHAMPFESNDRKLAFNRTVAVWKSNFEQVRKLVSEARSNVKDEVKKPRNSYKSP